MSSVSSISLTSPTYGPSTGLTPAAWRMNVGSVAGTGTHEETAEVVVAGASVLEW